MLLHGGGGSRFQRGCVRTLAPTTVFDGPLPVPGRNLSAPFSYTLKICNMAGLPFAKGTTANVLAS